MRLSEFGTAGSGGTSAAASRAAALAFAAFLAIGLTGCSSVPSWVNPMDWFGDDEPVAASGSAGAGQASTEERFPNLGRVPPRPVEQTGSAQRGQAIASLAADSANARYTDEELRGRPASSNALPPVPVPPTTQLPAVQGRASAPPLQGGAVPSEPLREMALARGEGAARLSSPGAVAQAPAAMTAASAGQPQNMGNIYASLLQASAATTLPAGMAQMQPLQAAAGGSVAPSAGSPAVVGSFSNGPVGSFGGSGELLAVVRFGNGGAVLDGRDKALIRQAAEFQRGIGGKAMLRVVAFAAPGELRQSSNPQAVHDLARRRAETVAAELQRQHVDARAIQAEARAEAPAAYQQASRRVDETSRRVEIHIVK